jgi:Uma2 family endonuclease
MTPPPGYQHDNAVSRLNRVLSDYLTATGDKGSLHFPRAGIMREPNSWLEPDLFYVSAETQTKLEPNYRNTADLVIEVISPGSAIYDRNTKADTYAALGVKELWLVDEVSRIIEVRLLKGDQFGPSIALESTDLLQSFVLRGLVFEVGKVFGD